MLQWIRDKTQGFVTWAIVSIICVTFAFWGISSYFMSSESAIEVATVNGEPITTATLNRHYQQLLQYQQSIDGREITLERQQALRDMALEQLIQQTLFVQAALEQGFTITDKEIFDLLAQIPELQEKGKFNRNRLENMLAKVGMTQTQFFHNLRQQLLVAQVQETILDSSFALPNELVDYIRYYYQMRDLTYVLIPYTAFEQRTPSDVPSSDAVKAYYKAHHADFMQPERVSLDYVLLKSDDPDFVKKSDQLANLSYEHPDSLLVVSEALNLPIQTTSLISTAGDDSSPVTSHADVLRAAFSDDLIRDHYNSEVIHLDSGELLIIRIHDHQPEKVKSLSEVRALIIDELQSQAAKKRAYAAGESLMKSLVRGKSLAQLAINPPLKRFPKQVVSRDTDHVNQDIMNALFQLPTRSFPQHTLIQLENGNVVLVELGGVHQVEQQKVDRLRADVLPLLSDSIGQAELAMYRHAVMDSAKIKRHSASSKD